MAKKPTQDIVVPPTLAVFEEPPPETIPITAVTGQNEAFLTILIRDLKAAVAEAQARRADGRVLIELQIASGNFSGGTISFKRLVGFGR